MALSAGPYGTRCPPNPDPTCKHGVSMPTGFVPLRHNTGTAGSAYNDIMITMLNADTRRVQKKRKVWHTNFHLLLDCEIVIEVDCCMFMELDFYTMVLLS